MGGILAAMMDVTVAQAAVIYSKNTQTVSTLEQKTSLVGPVRFSKKEKEDVPLMCRAKAVKSGRRVAFYEISLFDERNDKLVARASQTTLLIDIPKRAPKTQSKL